jgi:glycosyltransferase involved in cell wall biosynthesis
VKIAHIVPGSGGSFYCENCLRDTSIVSALRKRGDDVVMIPLYLPLFGHDLEGGGDSPIFFGGINTWLQEHLPVFRHTPRWIDRILDSEPLLRAAAGRAGSTSARGLGPMTVSMLRGEGGHQAKELDRLADYLAADVKPDVIHLSNALLLGLAARLRERTGAAVVCTLQDEAPWVDSMEGAWSERVWEVMAERARDADAFISVSRWYAGVMAGKIGLPLEKIRIVPIGVDADAYLPASPPADSPVLGYLGRESKAEGLGTLVDAFLRLRKEFGHHHLRLKITGGRTSEDASFLAGLRERLRAGGAAADVDFVEDFEWESRRAFLSSLSVLSVPGTAQAAFGLNILEALAAGVPVVQPRAGAFPELVETTGGGLLYDPEESGALAAALDELLNDPGHGKELGERGRAKVREFYSLDAMATRFATVYGEVTAGP